MDVRKVGKAVLRHEITPVNSNGWLLQPNFYSDFIRNFDLLPFIIQSETAVSRMSEPFSTVVTRNMLKPKQEIR